MANPRLDGRFQKTKRLNGRKIFGYGATAAEALADLEAKVQLAQAIGEPHRRLTLHEFVESYWGPTLDGRAPSTLKRYQGAYKNHIRIPLGGYDIRAITPAIVHQ